MRTLVECILVVFAMVTLSAALHLTGWMLRKAWEYLKPRRPQVQRGRWARGFEQDHAALMRDMERIGKDFDTVIRRVEKERGKR